MTAWPNHDTEQLRKRAEELEAEAVAIVDRNDCHEPEISSWFAAFRWGQAQQLREEIARRKSEGNNENL